MRRDFFGTPHVSDRIADADFPLILSEMEVDTAEIHAEVFKDEDEEKWGFEVRRNDDGETVIGGDPIFPSAEAATNYLAQAISRTDIDQL